MQLFIFLICLLCGAASGIVYDVFYILRTIICGYNIKQYTLFDKIIVGFLDILYFIIFAAIFILCSILFDFYQLRLYMFIGAGLGALIYLKSVHYILALFIKKVYNNIKVKSHKR
jgi:hypothetical protein